MAISVHRVFKKFRRGEQFDSLRDLLAAHLLGRRRSLAKAEFWAVHDISFDVRPGESFGIIGPNGAGKSTLLKLLAGIYPPTSGRRTVRGRISSLFDIALGFEYDATGWENIVYRSFLQGETPRSLHAKVQPIAEFSELGEFLTMPVRYYSAGMMVRLAFSIATAIEPEIFIVDEVLAAGDLAFQAKARQRMRELMSSARAVVVVSHDLGALSLLCDRAVWLDRGQIRRIGPTEEIVAAYMQDAQQPAAPQRQAA